MSETLSYLWAPLELVREGRPGARDTFPELLTARGITLWHSVPENRIKLIARVYQKAFDETESFQDDPVISSTLLYLLGAMAKGTTIMLWEDCFTLAAFREWFPPHDEIWSFIEIGVV